MALADFLNGGSKNLLTQFANATAPLPAQSNSYAAPSSGYSTSYRTSNVAAAPAGPSAAEIAAQQTRSAINTGYDDFIKALQGIAGNVDSRIASYKGEVGAGYDTSKTQLDNARASSQAKLTSASNQVEQNKVKSIRDLRSTVSNMLQASQIKAGLGGGGDSSADPMLKYAFAQQANRGTADLTGQAQNNLNDINLQSADLERNYGNQMSALEQWRKSEENKIVQHYQDIKDAIGREQAGANLERQQALANLNIQLAQSTGARLTQLNSLFTQASGALTSALTGANPNVSALAVNANVPQMQARQVQGLSF